MLRVIKNAGHLRVSGATKKQFWAVPLDQGNALQTQHNLDWLCANMPAEPVLVNPADRNIHSILACMLRIKESQPNAGLIVVNHSLTARLYTHISYQRDFVMTEHLLTDLVKNWGKIK